MQNFLQKQPQSTDRINLTVLEMAKLMGHKQIVRKLELTASAQRRLKRKNVFFDMETSDPPKKDVAKVSG